MDRYLLCLGQTAMIITGITFYFIIAFLAYQTYKSATENESYCTLWTDIPGRLSILLISFYIAGVCGCFPLPDSWRLQCLPKPFAWCKIRTWRKLVDKYRDRRLAMRVRTDTDFQSSSSASPSFSADERQSINKGQWTYGATREIQVPIPKNSTRRFRRENLISFSGSSDNGNRPLGIDVPKHPETPWSLLKSEEIYRTPYEECIIRRFENPAMKKMKLFPHNSEHIHPPPRRSLRRERCITDPSSDSHDTASNAASCPETLQFHISLESSLASNEIAECMQNVNDQTENDDRIIEVRKDGLAKENMGSNVVLPGASPGTQRVDEDARVESVGSPDCAQLHLPLGNSSRDLSSSDVTDESRENVNAHRMQHSDEESEAEHTGSPDSTQFYISM